MKPQQSKNTHQGTRRAALYAAAPALVIWSLTAGCTGDWSEYSPDKASIPGDGVDALEYPSGPYNTNLGDVMENWVFKKALFDPWMHCKKLKNLDLKENRGVESLSMADFYKGSPFCPRKKQFLWIFATAGW